MKLRFTKMHGLGNDFVVLDAVNQSIELTPEMARYLANRNFGIGCDQILVVEKPASPDNDFRYRIYNADGGEVEQCGNGARCFARFVHDQGLTAKTEIRVETRSGLIAPRMSDDGQVTVDMGLPRLQPAEIPFVSDSDAPARSRPVATTSISYCPPSSAESFGTFTTSSASAASPGFNSATVALASRRTPAGYGHGS